MSLLVVTLMGSLLGFLFWSAIRRRCSQSYRNPTNWPILGMLPALLVNLGDTYYDWVTTLLVHNGGSFHFRGPWLLSGNMDTLVTADPRNIEHALRTNFANYPKGPDFIAIFHDLLGDGIFNADHDLWRLQRKAASLHLHSRPFREFSDLTLFSSAPGKLLPILRGFASAETVFDFQNLMLRFTFDTISLVVFGVDTGCLRPDLPSIPFASAFETALDCASSRFNFPPSSWKLLKLLRLGKESGMHSALRCVHSFLQQVVDDRRATLSGTNANYVHTSAHDANVHPNAHDTNVHPNAHDANVHPNAHDANVHPNAHDTNVNPSAHNANVHPDNDISIGRPNDHHANGVQPSGHNLKHTPHSDLLSCFVKMEDETNDHAHNDKFLKDVVINFLLAGRDTSALALSWFFWLLASHPHVEEKLAREVETILGSDANQLLHEGVPVHTREKLNDMTYLHAALSESLRLYPSVPIDMKYVVHDDVLPDGNHVKKGQRFLYNIYCMGRMESLWGPDCASFRPERWLYGDGTSCRLTNASPFEFAAFNAGPRTCLGKEMAYTLMKVVASTIIINFHVVLAPHRPKVVPKLCTTLYMKEGFHVTLKPRARRIIEVAK